jgi:hypothetical protein
MAVRVAWKGMAKDVAAWCRDCQACACGKVMKQPAANIQPIPVPTKRFFHVHVDLVGPLSTLTDGYRYLFTMVERNSCWVEVVPLCTINAAACTATFVQHF